MIEYKLRKLDDVELYALKALLDKLAGRKGLSDRLTAFGLHSKVKEEIGRRVDC